MYIGIVFTLVAALCYRFHLQERVFIVAESLMAMGLLSYEAIYVPVNLSQPGLRSRTCEEYWLRYLGEPSQATQRVV